MWSVDPGVRMAEDGVRVTIRALTKRFGVPGRDPVVAVDALDLDIEPGSMVAVTGPSGSGKSTLLHLIGAVERADEGTVTVGRTRVTGLCGRQLAGYRRGVGLVFQSYHLLPALSAIDNVLIPLVPYRTGYDRTARARELLAQVGLAGRERARPAELSGGQQQRVAIARALIGGPGLLLADEPTGNLDSRAGDEIIELLLGLRARTGMTVLVATHSAQVAAACDRLVRLRDGAIVDDQPITADHPAEETVRRVNRLSV